MTEFKDRNYLDFGNFVARICGFENIFIMMKLQSLYHETIYRYGVESIRE
jgi:hypothetical protein